MLPSYCVCWAEWPFSDLIKRMKAKQVMIDALSGFELALAAFRKSLYQLVAVLNGMRVTVLMAAELEDRYPGLRFSTATHSSQTPS